MNKLKKKIFNYLKKDPYDDWIEHILNMRFFKLPNNIQIETRYGYHHDVRDFHRNYLKPLTGYQPFLNSMSLSKGSLRLGNANYYWWILKESVPVHGHAALINQGEIFERKEHWENTLALFGILVGRNRLVIYVEPDDVAAASAALFHYTLIRADSSA
jgi:hypothetical protein